MAKLTMIGVLLCASLFVVESMDMEKPNLSQHLIVTMPKSTTVANDMMWTMSMTDSNVHVNSSDPNKKPCDMAIDSAKDSIKSEMHVAVTNKFMYILGEHGDEKVDGQDKTKFILLIIDLDNCKLERADVPLAEQWNSLPDMVTHHNGVDLFFPKMETCVPCRFSNDGKRMAEALPQIPAPAASSDGMPHGFLMASLGKNKLMYAQNLEGDKTMLKVLDNEKMDVLKEKEVDYPVDTLMKTNNADGMVGICSKKYDDMLADIVAYKEINCVQMDENLESHAPIKITIGPHSEPVSSVSYNVDKATKNIYIGLATDQNLGLHVYDKEGKLMKSYDMGKIDERFEKYEHQPMFYSPYSHWDVHGLIAGKHYCLVTKQVSGYDKHEVELHDVRCIDTLK